LGVGEFIFKNAIKGGLRTFAAVAISFIKIAKADVRSDRSADKDEAAEKAPDGRGVRDISTQFEVTAFPEQQSAKQGLSQLSIAQAIPHAQQLRSE
jgi:hypothetical protein